jgi:hypothetical protein
MNDEDDLPPKPHEPEQGAAGAFGQLFGATAWIALFVVVVAVVIYFLSRTLG